MDVACETVTKSGKSAPTDSHVLRRLFRWTTECEAPLCKDAGDPT